MGKRWLFGVLAALVMASGASVYAAEGTTQGAVFTVTPRVWFAFVDQADNESTYDDVMSMPLYGLSLSVNKPQTTNWSVLINGYSGTADNDLISTSEGSAVHHPGTADYDRYDIELLARYSFPGTGLGLFFGPRYVNWQRDQNVPKYVAGMDLATTSDTDIWIPEVGVSCVSEIGESGKHRFFSNLTVGMAFISWEATAYLKLGGAKMFAAKISDRQTEPCVDANIGYEFFFMKSSSVSLRYCLFLLREEIIPGQQGYTSYHGPEIGVSIRF